MKALNPLRFKEGDIIESKFQSINFWAFYRGSAPKLTSISGVIEPSIEILISQYCGFDNHINRSLRTFKITNIKGGELYPKIKILPKQTL